MNRDRSVPGWAFPRHRPQLYASSTLTLQALVPYYSFGRPLTPLTRFSLRTVLATPGLRRLVTGNDPLSIPFDEATFGAILEVIGDVVEQSSWGIFQSSWHSDRLIIFSLARGGRCTGVTHVAPIERQTFHPRSTSQIIAVPEVLATRTLGDWSLRVEAPLPGWHGPHPWDFDRLTEVTSAIEAILVDTIDPRQEGDPSWVPIHGDMTPWNLRVDRSNGVWLLDWEWAGWGPPHTDLVRFALAHCSLTLNEPSDMFEWMNRHVTIEPEPLVAAASYWLSHRMYRDAIVEPASDGLEAEHRQARSEVAVLRMLAERS